MSAEETKLHFTLAGLARKMFSHAEKTEHAPYPDSVSHEALCAGMEKVGYGFKTGDFIVYVYITLFDRGILSRYSQETSGSAQGTESKWEIHALEVKRVSSRNARVDYTRSYTEIFDLEQVSEFPLFPHDEITGQVVVIERKHERRLLVKVNPLLTENFTTRIAFDFANLAEFHQAQLLANMWKAQEEATKEYQKLLAQTLE